MSRTPAQLRAEAARILQQVRGDGRSLSAALPPVLATLDGPARGQLQDWCFGSCRWYFQLQDELQQRLNKPLGKKLATVEALLLIGLYQLRHTRIAPHAAIHETVSAVRELGQPRLSGLVNGVLRAAEREGPKALRTESARLSHPTWMLDKLRANWPEHWQDIVAGNNGRPPMTLRVNRRHQSREAALTQLQEAGIDAQPCSLANWGIQLAQPLPVDQIPGFADGHYSVQDEAAQLCTQLLALAPGQRVLDACAAPGGKTGAMLEAEPGLEELVALDSDPQRLPRIEENLERLQQSATLQVADASDPDTWWDGRPFDRILLDAPCSGTGVIRRHPDIKLLRREQDIKALADLQLALLRACWRTLATGGRLVYATCSVFPQENSRIIQRFITAQFDAELELIPLDWGEDTGYDRQLFPQEGGHDGFFYASLRKNPGAQV